MPSPSPLSVKSVLRASRRYWWLILALWTVGSAGIGAWIYLRIKPIYQASSWLEVEPNEIDLYGGIAHGGGEPYMQTHVTLIKSPNVLSAATILEKVRKWPRMQTPTGDPMTELNRAVTVGIRPGTQIIEVSMSSTIAAEAADMVNAVVSEFLALNKTWSNKNNLAQIKKLQDYNKKLNADIQRLLTELRALNEKRNLHAKVVPIKPTRDDDDKNADQKKEQQSFDWTVEAYQKTAAECQDLKFRIILAENDLEETRRIAREVAQQTKLESNKAPHQSARLERDPELVTLLGQIKAAQEKVKKIGIDTNNSGDAAQVRAKQNATNLIKQYQLLREQKQHQWQTDPTSGASDPMMEVVRAEKSLNEMIRRRDFLEESLSKTKVETTKEKSVEFEYQLLSQDHAALVDMSRVITKKLEDLNFSSTNNDERIRLVNEARPENLPIADKRFQYVAMAPVGVLGAVLGLVVLLELRSGRVADTDILSSRLKHEVFAIAPLPNMRPGIGMDSDKTEQRLARFVQSLDHLRVALCDGGTNGEGRCVMITSATGGEGKTTLSAHLAARCANAGTSTLLIDADLRRASLGRLLDVTPGPGLGDLLAGQAELDGGLISAQAGGFHFLSAGTPGIDPTRVLKSNRLAELIGQLRQMYDLILIDTPPVLPVADALIMGRWADGAVMASRYDASRLPLVERANRQIIAAGIPVLGVVVNGVKGHDQAYGNYAYNYSYPGRQEPLNETSISS